MTGILLGGTVWHRVRLQLLVDAAGEFSSDLWLSAEI